MYLPLYRNLFLAFLPFSFGLFITFCLFIFYHLSSFYVYPSLDIYNCLSTYFSAYISFCLYLCWSIWITICYPRSLSFTKSFLNLILCFLSALSFTLSTHLSLFTYFSLCPDLSLSQNHFMSIYLSICISSYLVISSLIGHGGAWPSQPCSALWHHIFQEIPHQPATLCLSFSLSLHLSLFIQHILLPWINVPFFVSESISGYLSLLFGLFISFLSLYLFSSV